MKEQSVVPISLVILIAITLSCGPQAPTDGLPHYPISAIPFTDIELQDTFWRTRIKTNRDVTIPFALQKCEEEGRIRNFERAGGLIGGKYEGYMPFDDTDVYKIIEGASYSLQTNPDEKLDAYIDDIIQKIAAAQEDDGYLTTWKTINPDTTPAPWVQPGPRWYDLRSSHELYNAGHMYEAAYAHYRATGKTNFLDIALKNADLIDEIFGPGKLETPPGHQIIETGLLKLYKATANKKYLNLAKFFLDCRGDSTTHALYGSYSQDHIPVIEQDEAVGHAVRAVYMYAGMVDIAAYMNDAAYLNAVDKIWDNVVSKKLYITGGLGARHSGEAFGDNYELPNLTAYSETCAAIASVYWNHRLFLLNGDAKYIDVLERTLYNGLISGVSLEGDSFFYPNCLASDGHYAFNQGAATRKAWFDCSCCPSNIIRFMPSVPDYIYGQRGDTLYANLFIASRAEIELNGSTLEIVQKTDYPWDGQVEFEIAADKEVSFSLKVRIPGWAQDQPVPSDLYRYRGEKSANFQLSVNGEPVASELKKGYVTVRRAWSDGDILELDLPMPVRQVVAHENVKENVNKIALERGPLVYCAEGIDNQNRISDYVITDDSQFDFEHRPDMLNGITTITGAVSRVPGQSAILTAIPYYAWSHRGVGQMAVWLGSNR